MGTLMSDGQLMDIIATHVCCKLRPNDIQALGQTCKALRQLVKDQIPASAWESVAAKALPAAHPLLLLPGGELRSCLERNARAKSVLPEPTLLGIWKDQNDNRNTTSAINHQGSQIMTRKGPELSVFELDLDSSPPSLKLVFTEALLEPADTENKITITWSPDDAYAAIYFMGHQTAQATMPVRTSRTLSSASTL
ncbi:hypothetical protein WJX73_005887 [Symbiochloris irregularis]|uniref:F-box domain-containing protein n=1 Tax=Symbiochloris irregularis TaxID=706552 RepID=A0AAW1NUV1_9CHLO